VERPVRLRHYIAYGLGDFLGGGSFAIIGTLFLFFMTEVVGILPVYAGLLYFISKLWDAVSDPLMGYISDRTRSRFGRRRIYFLICMVPIGIFFALLWIPVNWQGQGFLFWWYLFVFMGFSTFYTILMVPYTALNAEMSLDYKVRARLSGFKQIGSGLSGALCSVASKPLIDSFPDPRTGFTVMGLIFGLFFSLPWVAVFFGTWEIPRRHREVEKQNLVRIFQHFFSVFKNRSFRIHLGMYVSGFAGLDVAMSLFIIFLTHYLLRENYFPYLMAALALAQGLFLPIHITTGNRYGQGRAYLLGSILFLAGMLYAATLAPGPTLPLMLAAAAILGSGMCGLSVMPWVILPSVTDVDELITAEKRAGLYSGMMTLLRKATNALVIFLVGAALNRVGYVPGQVQGIETANGLRYLFLIAPAACVFIGLLFSLKFKITPQTHKVIRSEIDRLEGGGSKEQACADTQRICEELTGIPYAMLYRPHSSKEIYSAGHGTDSPA